MKFCPNCGSPLEGKTKCNCGYNVETNEVDEKEYEEFKNREKTLYEQQCDNMPFGMMTKEQYLENTKKMGIDSNISNDEILNQRSQPIFNKENDNLKGEDLVRIIENFYDNKDKEEDTK